MKFREEVLNMLSADKRDLLERIGAISTDDSDDGPPRGISFDNEKSKEFVKHIRAFLLCKNESKKLIDKIDPEGRLASLVLPSSFDPDDEKFQQRSLDDDDDQPVRNMDELYRSADEFLPEFRNLVEGLEGRLRTAATGDATDGQFHVKFAPLKDRKRAGEKAKDDYSDRNGEPVAWLYDIVRGSVYCDTPEQLLKFVELLREDLSPEIVKAKNRFEKPTLSGYRDMNLCLRIANSRGRTHICELQIHIKCIKELSEELQSHPHYEFFRTFYAGATASLGERMNDLGQIFQDESGPNQAGVAELMEQGDLDRLGMMATLCEEYLCEFPLALQVRAKILELQLKETGSDMHVDVADTYHNMAIVLEKQGKYDAAMDMYRLALTIRKEALGEQHSKVGDTYYNMAMLRKEQGNLDKAFGLYQNAFEVYRKVYGETHSETVDALEEMASMLQLQGTCYFRPE